MAILINAIPALQLRADYAAGYSGGAFPSNGGSVTAFTPEIGNATGSLGTAPTYQNSGGPNSKPYLRFVAGALQCIDNTFLQSSLDGCWTAVMVYRVASTSDATQVLFAKGSALNMKGVLAIGQTSVSSSNDKLIWGSTSASQVSTGTVADSTWRLAIIVGRGTIGSSGQTTDLVLDGAFDRVGTTVSVSTITSGNKFTVGGYPAGSNYFASGNTFDLAELTIYSRALSRSECLEETARCRSEYALTTADTACGVPRVSGGYLDITAPQITGATSYSWKYVLMTAAAMAPSSGTIPPAGTAITGASGSGAPTDLHALLSALPSDAPLLIWCEVVTGGGTQAVGRYLTHTSMTDESLRADIPFDTGTVGVSVPTVAAMQAIVENVDWPANKIIVAAMGNSLLDYISARSHASDQLQAKLDEIAPGKYQVINGGQSSTNYTQWNTLATSGSSGGNASEIKSPYTTTNYTEAATGGLGYSNQSGLRAAISEIITANGGCQMVYIPEEAITNYVSFASRNATYLGVVTPTGSETRKLLSNYPPFERLAGDFSTVVTNNRVRTQDAVNWEAQAATFNGTTQLVGIPRPKSLGWSCNHEEDTSDDSTHHNRRGSDTTGQSNYVLFLAEMITNQTVSDFPPPWEITEVVVSGTGTMRGGTQQTLTKTVTGTGDPPSTGTWSLNTPTGPGTFAINASTGVVTAPGEFESGASTVKARFTGADGTSYDEITITTPAAGAGGSGGGGRPAQMRRGRN